MIGASLSPPAAQAGPVDDARKLLEAKQYDKVDEVLAKDLEAAAPSADALRLSLAAAVARGRIITAQQRVTMLLKVVGEADLDLVYQAAQISEQAGERRSALSRYLIYARTPTDKPERTKHALEYLVTRGKFPGEYTKAVKLLGANERTWQLGLSMVKRLVTDQDAGPALDVCRFMAETFGASPERATALHAYLRFASERGYLGSDPRRKYILPLQIMMRQRPSNPEHLVRMVSTGRQYLSGAEAAEILLAIHQSNDIATASHCLSLLERLRYAREGSDPLSVARKVYQALEPIYAESKDAGAYAAFVRAVYSHRDSFRAGNETVFDEATLSAMLAQVVKKGATREVTEVLARLCDRNAPLLQSLARKYAGLIAPDKASWVIGRLDGNAAQRAEQIKAATPFVQAFVKGRGARESVLARLHLTDWYRDTGDKAAMLAAARDAMAAYPGNFDWNRIWNVWNAKNVTVDEKVALLRNQFTRSGQSDSMNQLIPNRIARDAEMRKDRTIQAMIREYGRRPKGTDAVMKFAVIALGQSLGRRGQSPNKLLGEAIKAYGKPVPGSTDAAASVTEIALVDGVSRMLDHSSNPAQLLASTPLGARLMPGPIMARALVRSTQFNPQTLVAKIAPRLTGADAATMKIWWALSFAKNPKDDTKAILAPYYKRMGWDNAARYLLGQTGSWHQRGWRIGQWGKNCWTRETFINALDELMATEGFALTDQTVHRDLRSAIGRRGRGDDRAAPTEEIADAMWQGYLNGVKAAGQYDVGVEASVLGIYRAAGAEAASDWIDVYVEAVAGRTPAQRVAAISNMMRAVGPQRVMIEKGKSPYLRLFARAAETYKAMSDAQWSAAGIQEETYKAAAMLANNVPWRQALKGQGDILAAGKTLNAEFDTRLLAGARWVSGHNPVPRLCQRAAEGAAAQKDWPAAIAATRQLAESLGTGASADSYKSEITAVARSLETAGANEILYAFLRQVEQGGRLSSTMSKEIAMLRARAAKDITGLVSVSPNDPTYPLHLAAQALLLGNETRAWELSGSQASLFAKSWEGLDPNFVDWYVRQLYKQKQFETVLSLTRNILQKESSLDVEVAASIHLTVGDVRRRQENNDAALEIYKALEASDRYKDTRAATQARYRQVLLMIATGAYGEAEDTLARMVESPSIDEQAEAYFLLAKLADEQKEYRKADQYLTKVRARVPDHIEAAFLEGELRSKAPSMLARGEILEIGVVAMETVAVPGRELVFRLQDSNLAIAKGSTTIPITVETSTGKDRETVELILSGTAKNMFKGTIVAALGKIAPGDGVLQLRGEDVVTYRIADDFQKSHDISYKPKTLTVKADGELAASAGRILTEKEIAQREIELRLARARGEKPPAWASEKRKSVRPGSPVYVQVKDLDRDVSGTPDTVTVSVKTTGGDMLDAVTLTETGANTGVFMGRIPTSMPLPKGLASDTFEGKSPAWLIQSTTGKVWSSVDDGVKDKWVEADTMTSHLVKRVSLEVPDASKIKSLSLSGRLSGAEERPQAVYPLLGQQQGLRLELFADDGLKKTTAERTVPSVSRVRANDLGKGNVAARYSGMIVAPYSEEYTFGLDVRGARARLLVDGKAVVDQWPDKGDGRGATGKVQLQAGREVPFVLEFAGSAKNAAQGECGLLWQSKTVSRQAIPVAATYPGPTASRMDDLRHRKITVAATADHPLRTYTAIRSHLKTSDKAAAVPHIKTTSVMPGRDELGVLAGVFSVPSERMLAVKLTATGVGPDSRAYLLIDGRREIGGKLSDLVDKTGNVFLRKGAHRMELVYRSAGKPTGATRIGVEIGDSKGTFAAMPWQWFSADHTPDLADAILPNGLIAVSGNTFTATFRTPARLRTVRWNFHDFAGKDVAAKKITVTNAQGKNVIPVEKDFTTSLTNDVLEIAPGDRISLKYIDEKNLQGESASRKAGLGLGRGASLSVSFDDGEIELAHEEKRTDAKGNVTEELFTARRCSVGDVLTVLVADQDVDQTPKRDVVRVVVTTSGGKKLELEIPEEVSRSRSGEVDEICHTGRFVARVKLAPAGAAPKKATAKPATQPAKKIDATLQVAPGEEIVVRYLDLENNDGVPIDRITRLTEGGAGFGGWSVMRTRARLVVDTSYGAALLRDDMRRISGDPEIEVYTQVIDHLSPLVKADEDDEEPTVDRGTDAAGLPICSVRGPLQFSMLYPRMARNTGSTVKVIAVAESEIAAAKAAKRKVKGAIVTLSIPDEDELDAGRFHGRFDLQIGVPGDKLTLEAAAAATDEQDPIKTIIVRGDEVVQLRYKDPETGKTVMQRVRLLADGRMEVLERTLRARKLRIHLGQKFYLRVADPDKDVSDARDEVIVKVKASSGDAADVTLTETLVHSGVFTGSIEPRWVKQRGRYEAADKAKAAAAKARAAAEAKAKADAAARAKAAAEAAKAKGDKPAKDATPAPKPKAVPAPKPAPKPAPALYADFGDTVSFSYTDAKAVSTTEPLILQAEGLIVHGADGEVALFTKRYKDPEMAVKVSFLTAEALFSMGKDLRRKGRKELAETYIARGKDLLERALQNYPNTSLVAQGEFLVATLAQELGKYSEARGKYSEVIQRWTKSPYAPKAMYAIAQCYEAEKNYDRAIGEYVRVTYLFPDSPEVTRATLRIGNHYLRQARLAEAAEKPDLARKSYAVAGRILEKFHDNHPKHSKAAASMLLAGECYRICEDYQRAIALFTRVTKEYRDNNVMRAEAMYWKGVCAREIKDYVTAYRALKRLTWDYPESNQAANARRLLVGEEFEWAEGEKEDE